MELELHLSVAFHLFHGEATQVVEQGFLAEGIAKLDLMQILLIL
jgi:hypothetical protein